MQICNIVCPSKVVGKSYLKVKKKKENCNSTLFHLLELCGPISNFENMHGLLSFWKVENNLKNHWTYTSGWGMVGCMNNVVLATTKMAIQTIKFINVSCNEVTSIDNQSWIFIHVFVVKDFKRTPIFVNLEGAIKTPQIALLWNKQWQPQVHSCQNNYSNCIVMDLTRN
jgi:hypothetical protein